MPAPPGAPRRRPAQRTSSRRRSRPLAGGDRPSCRGHPRRSRRGPRWGHRQERNRCGPPRCAECWRHHRPVVAGCCRPHAHTPSPLRRGGLAGMALSRPTFMATGPLRLDHPARPSRRSPVTVRPTGGLGSRATTSTDMASHRGRQNDGPSSGGRRPSAAGRSGAGGRPASAAHRPRHRTSGAHRDPSPPLYPGAGRRPATARHALGVFRRSGRRRDRPGITGPRCTRSGITGPGQHIPAAGGRRSGPDSTRSFAGTSAMGR